MKKAKRHLPATVVVIALLIIFAIIGSLCYIKYLKTEYDKEIKNKLENISKSGSDNVNRLVTQIYGDLTGFSKILLNQGEENYREQTELLGELCEDNGYLSIGVADEEGSLFATNGISMSVASTENFEKSLRGEPWLISTIVEGIANNVLVFSVPIGEKDSVSGVIYAICDSYYFYEHMQREEYLVDGTRLIVKKDGTVECEIVNMDRIEIGDNIFEYFYDASKKNELKIDKMCSAMKSGQKGSLTVSDDGTSYMYYYPMGINDWYFVTVIPSDIMTMENDKIISSAYIVTSIFVILYLITFLIVMRMQNNNRKKIERIAYVDELTGGISFDKFKKDAAEIIKNSNGKSYVMVSIDIDKFKVINDIFGYEEGNRVIRYIWSAIDKVVEEDETFAHRRADQFVILLEYQDNQKMIERIEELSLRIHQRETQNEKNYEIILSMGIYIINKETDSDLRIDNIIDRAELAKQSVKGKHNQFYAVYDETLRQKILRDQEIENRMEKALEKEEFKVYYQPKYDSRTCELTGAEALVRWYNEKTGMIFPNEFIPLFESNGFIIELDKYMFEQVCKDIQSWMNDSYKVVPVSVNLSQLQLYNMHFVEEYQEILEKYNIPPECVQLELTETTLFSEESILNKIIDKLHGIGFKILMDDFGTGYSSLHMLKNVPIDILKLDKSFVDGIGDSKVDIVVSTIVSLGQSLDMKIVAEGVETKEQYEFLRDIFCDEIQGYYFSRPIAEKEYRQQMIKEADIIGY